MTLVEILKLRKAGAMHITFGDDGCLREVVFAPPAITDAIGPQPRTSDKLLAKLRERVQAGKLDPADAELAIREAEEAEDQEAEDVVYHSSGG